MLRAPPLPSSHSCRGCSPSSVASTEDNRMPEHDAHPFALCGCSLPSPGKCAIKGVRPYGTLIGHLWHWLDLWRAAGLLVI